MEPITPQQVLKTYFGYDSFRPLQENIISTILGKQDCLAIVPTGGGKSICFQIPGLMFEGTTIVISPLISLMEDQVQQLQKRNIAAVQLSSSLDSAQRKVIEEKIAANKVSFIYLSPEQLQTQKWLQLSRSLTISLVVIDEAHCISQWGHDFRPPYRQISNWVESLTKRPVLAAFTATATPQTAQDIINSLQLHKVKTIKQDSLPAHLYWGIVNCSDNFHRWLRLFQLVKKHKGQSGIIYTLTRKATEQLSALISQFFPLIKTAFYHGGMTAENRRFVQEQFIENKLDLIVATNAFGMGVDKPNIRFVIHFHTPNSIEAYTQEVGRAGRDRNQAWCYLLLQLQNQKINRDLLKDDKNKQAKYKQMLKLVTTKHCLKKSTANYFAIEHPASCDACSHCVNSQSFDKSLFSHLLQLTKVIEFETGSKPAFILSKKQAALLSVLAPLSESQLRSLPGFGLGWLEKSHPLLCNDKMYRSLITE